MKSQLNGEGVEAQSKQSRRKKAASSKNDISANCESAETRNDASASPKGNDASAASGPGTNYRKAPIRGYVSSRDARYHIMSAIAMLGTILCQLSRCQVLFYVSSGDARYHIITEAPHTAIKSIQIRIWNFFLSFYFVLHDKNEKISEWRVVPFVLYFIPSQIVQSDQFRTSIK